MSKYYSLSIWLFLLPFWASAQNIHPVEPVEFTPPEKSMIESFTGSPAMAIQANNIQGKAVAVPSTNDQPQLLWFGQQQDLRAEVIQLLANLNESNQVNLHLFLDEKKSQIQDTTNLNLNKYSVVPNSSMLSQAVFGSELGHNRGFLIDPSGIITKVFVWKEIKAQIDPEEYIMSFITP